MGLSVTSFVGREKFISADVAPSGFPGGEKNNLGEIGGRGTGRGGDIGCKNSKASKCPNHSMSILTLV